MGRRAKLNEKQIIEIRASELSNKELSVHYGTTPNTISAVRNGKGAYRFESSGETEEGISGSSVGNVQLPNQNGGGQDCDGTGDHELQTSGEASSKALFNTLFRS